MYDAMHIDYLSPDVPIGPVVRKSINANPGRKGNLCFNFSCTKVSFTVIIFVELETGQSQN